jgi:hypothetical protein
MNHDKIVHEVIPFNAGVVSVREFTPRSSWSEMGESDHFVQFYEADTFLLNSLGGYIGEGLDKGDACVVVATKPIREGLETHLRERGLDLSAAAERGQYVSLDAAATLSEFMVDGSPEYGRFVEVIEGTLARAAEGRGRMRVFGEMVALLCSEGKHTAAISLEGLWNDLQKTRPFSLFCAYPMNIFGGNALAGSPMCARATRASSPPKATRR